MEPLNVDPTLGVYQIGVLVSYALFVMVTTQTYVYSTRFPDDSAKTKTLVGFVWLCEAVHAVCIAATQYSYTITGYGDPNRLLHAPTTLFIVVFLSGIMGGSVQSFFAFRIYLLSKKLYIPCVCWALSFLRILGTTVAFVAGHWMVSLPGYEVQWKWLLTAILSVVLANDLLVALTLAFFLYRQRSNADTRTIPVVNKMISWTIETGMITSASAIVMLLLFNAFNNIWAFLAVFVTASRLYSNSLLASLNSRTTLREMHDAGLPHGLSPIINLPISCVRVSQVSIVTHDSGPIKSPEEV